MNSCEQHFFPSVALWQSRLLEPFEIQSLQGLRSRFQNFFQFSWLSQEHHLLWVCIYRKHFCARFFLCEKYNNFSPETFTNCIYRVKKTVKVKKLYCKVLIIGTISLSAMSLLVLHLSHITNKISFQFLPYNSMTNFIKSQYFSAEWDVSSKRG